MDWLDDTPQANKLFARFSSHLFWPFVQVKSFNKSIIDIGIETN